MLVGIVIHISSKSISTNISKKEFERNNKINVAINEHRNKIMDYEMFMNLYNNSNVFFNRSKWYLIESFSSFLNKIY